MGTIEFSDEDGVDLKEIIDRLTKSGDQGGRPRRWQSELKDAFRNFQLAASLGELGIDLGPDFRQFQEEGPEEDGRGRPGFLRELLKLDFSRLITIVDEESEIVLRKTLEAYGPKLGVALAAFTALGGALAAEWIAEDKFADKGWPPVLHVGQGLLLAVLTILDALSALFKTASKFLGGLGSFGFIPSLATAAEVVEDILDKVPEPVKEAAKEAQEALDFATGKAFDDIDKEFNERQRINKEQLVKGVLSLEEFAAIEEEIKKERLAAKAKTGINAANTVNEWGQFIINPGKATGKEFRKFFGWK